MRESYDEIRTHLKRYKLDQQRMLLQLISQIVLRNNDFDLLLKSDEEQQEIVEIISDMTGKIFPLDQMRKKVSLKEKELLEQMSEIDLNGMQALKKLRKTKTTEILASALDSDLIFEGFCIAFYGQNEMLEILADDFGCSEKLAMLAEDPVYRKRRKYQRTLTRYTMAAVNLYGVLHIKDLQELISEYEPRLLKDTKGYSRPEGSYPITMIFSPEWWSTYTLHQLTGNCIPKIATTMDAFMLNNCFLEDAKDENEEMIAAFSKLNHAPTEVDLDHFFGNSDAPYRQLYAEAIEKEWYLPSAKEFLRYEDENYYEHSKEEEKLRTYLKRTFGKEFETAAKGLDMTRDQLIDFFLTDLHWEFSDADGDGERDLNDSIQEVFRVLESYGITLSGIDQANQFLRYLMPLINSVRLWSNHGYTPNEMHKLYPVRPDNLTVMPGSSKAAAMLSESRKELEQMGFHLDLEGNASEVTQFAFSNGINGKAKTTTRKIYPNDPCPCGSGKKYKKCCGKRS